MKVEYLEDFYHSYENALQHYADVDKKEGTNTVSRLISEINEALSTLTAHPVMFPIKRPLGQGIAG